MKRIVLGVPHRDAREMMCLFYDAITSYLCYIQSWSSSAVTASLSLIKTEGEPSDLTFKTALSFTSVSDVTKSLATGAIDGDGPAVHCATVRVNIRCIRRAG